MEAVVNAVTIDEYNKWYKYYFVIAYSSMITNLETEEWRDVKGYEGYYQVSNCGRVKSLDRTIQTWHGHRTIRGKIKSPSFNRDGYLVLSLSKHGIGKGFLVSRLVALHFIPNPDNLPEVLHIDNMPSNNYVTNLKWGTHQQNIQEAWRDGLMEKARIASTKLCSERHGEKCPAHKLTSIEVLEIRNKYATGQYVQKDLARQYNISKPQMCRIVNRQLWRHI